MCLGELGSLGSQVTIELTTCIKCHIIHLQETGAFRSIQMPNGFLFGSVAVKILHGMPSCFDYQLPERQISFQMQHLPINFSRTANHNDWDFPVSDRDLPTQLR